MPVTEAQFRAQVALNRLDVDSEEEAQCFVEGVQKELKKPARKRARTKEQAAKHKKEQRDRKKARDPQGYKEQKQRQRENYKKKQKAEAEKEAAENAANLAELLAIVDE